MHVCLVPSNCNLNALWYSGEWWSSLNNAYQTRNCWSSARFSWCLPSIRKRVTRLFESLAMNDIYGSVLTRIVGILLRLYSWTYSDAALEIICVDYLLTVIPSARWTGSIAQNHLLKSYTLFFFWTTYWRANQCFSSLKPYMITYIEILNLIKEQLCDFHFSYDISIIHHISDLAPYSWILD
jgi:hypothetical protein